MSLPVAAADLTNLLMSQIGVTQPQAEGGAGSIFQLAKSQMTMDNFQKLRAAIPGVDQYLGAAPPMALPCAAQAAGSVPQTASAPATGKDALVAKAGELLGQNSSLVGKFRAAEALAPAFDALGMKTTTMASFVPVVVDYVKSTGGKSVGKLLTRAIGL
jgi:hypothetical protein